MSKLRRGQFYLYICASVILLGFFFRENAEVLEQETVAVLQEKTLTKTQAVNNNSLPLSTRSPQNKNATTPFTASNTSSQTQSLTNSSPKAVQLNRPEYSWQKHFKKATLLEESEFYLDPSEKQV